MPIFEVNPIRQSLNYYTMQDGIVNKVTTTVNIQSENVYIAPDTNLQSSSYSRNVYLSPLNNLYSIPSSI